jgi:energy-converting hydrogenase Eha subunit C
MKSRRLGTINFFAGAAVVILPLLNPLPIATKLNLIVPGIVVMLVACYDLRVAGNAKRSTAPSLVALMAALWIFLATWFTFAVAWLMWALDGLSILVAISEAAFAQSRHAAESPGTLNK